MGWNPVEWVEDRTGIHPGRGGNTFGSVGTAIENATGVRFGGIDRTNVGIGPLINNVANAVVGASKRGDNQDNKDVNSIMAGQQAQYQEFQKRLPQMQQDIAEGLMKRSVRDIASGQRAATERMSARGMGYGGLAQSQRDQVQAQGQQSLANNMAQANQGLLGLGNQIQSGAIQTGLGLQSNLQDYQNAIYQQALQRQAMQNQMTGSVLGTVGNLGLLAALA